jgi:hypothetical protein
MVKLSSMQIGCTVTFYKKFSGRKNSWVDKNINGKYFEEKYFRSIMRTWLSLQDPYSLLQKGKVPHHDVMRGNTVG